MDTFWIEVTSGERQGWLARAVRGLIAPAEALYRAAVARRNRRYDSGRSRIHRAACPVVSIGNITVGGTGKTPAVLERARAELAGGKRVAVLTRGYGGGRRHDCIVVDHSISQDKLHARVGDEAALIARKAPDAVLVKCADRVAGARAAIERHGCDTLILDDGFQYVRLRRDENILVIDATNPFGNGRLIPRGILREPLEAMGRATAIYLTRCDLVEDLCPLFKKLDQLCPNVPVRKTCHAPKTLWRVHDGVQFPLDDLRGRMISAVCGIGNPESFFKTLEVLGAKVVERIALPDHGIIPPETLAKSGMIVMTEKDAVRIQAAPANLMVLGIELEDWE